MLQNCHRSGVAGDLDTIPDELSYKNWFWGHQPKEFCATHPSKLPLPQVMHVICNFEAKWLLRKDWADRFDVVMDKAMMDAILVGRLQL